MANPRKPRSLKIVAGTDRADRDGAAAVDLPLVDGIPKPPDWLGNVHAIKEWERLAPILCANKLLTEAALSTFAHLCAMHGEVVNFRAAGMPVHASNMAQLRGLSNDFGLTPVAQGKVKPSGEKEVSNRFQKIGKRPA